MYGNYHDHHVINIREPMYSFSDILVSDAAITPGVQGVLLCFDLFRLLGYYMPISYLSRRE